MIMNHLEIRLHFRILFLSLVVFVAGAVIAVGGIVKTVRYYSKPVDIKCLQENMQSGARIEITQYRVAGLFENSGFMYYIIECSEDSFFLIEVNKDSYYANILNSQNKSDVVDQKYVIEGIIGTFDSDQVDEIRSILFDKGYEESEIECYGIYKIKILENENTSIFLGLLLVVLALVCVILNSWMVKDKWKCCNE